MWGVLEVEGIVVESGEWRVERWKKRAKREMTERWINQELSYQ